MNSKTAYIKGFLWFAFSGTAMLAAFILPVHIWALTNDFTFQTTWLARIYFIVLMIAALYHSLYRVKTIVFDLGFGKYQKAVGYVATALFIIFSALTVYLFAFALSSSLL